MSFYCRNFSHNDSQIILFCLNEQCKQSRLLCDKCVQQDLHSGHYQDLVKFQDMNSQFQIKHKECQEIITFIQKQIDQSQELLSQIKNGLSQKYQLDYYRIQSLTPSQLTQAIIEVLFNNKIKQIEKDFQGGMANFNQLLRNLCTQIDLNNLPYRMISEAEKQKAQPLFKAGQDVYFYQNNFQIASDKFDQSLALNPFDKETLFFKSDCLRVLRKYDEALPWLDKALDIDPKHVNALYNKGECLRVLRKYDEALPWFNKALDIDPKHDGASGQKALTLKELNRHEDALVFFEKALLTYPNWEPYISGKEYCQSRRRNIFVESCESRTNGTISFYLKKQDEKKKEKNRFSTIIIKKKNFLFQG